MATEVDTGFSGKQYGEEWDECSRCGFMYPKSFLRRQPGDGGGVVVCVVIPCYDEPSSGDYSSFINRVVEEPPLIIE